MNTAQAAHSSWVPPIKRLPCMRVGPMPAPASTVTVVSGLPRSGTSLLMRALRAGGMPLLVDEVRQADDRNPHGYFEWEPVKADEDYRQWIGEARGRAVKVVSRHLMRLPPTHQYDVLFLHRDLGAVLRSQRDMALHHSDAAWQDAAVADLAGIYRLHVQDSLQWLNRRPQVRLHELRYEDLIADPTAELQRLCQALNRPADQALDVAAMAACVDPALNRAGRPQEPPHG
ncbi:sulfotransferase family protein [Roseateles amylovorans]|uniref:Sulfotransferase domain-containing protein n=1 Tax=Roseateles amylovorans TaxID=2978473 RepID=A0ABY6ATE2_9BURK|nr:sulfotransferase [Roseateles amylovorans]UXH76102.1 sulfotransferase domain-containing protein [Roseateles amylovorans]